MRLHVMRHGPAEDRAPSGRDFDRALTPAGRLLVRRMGELLRAAVPEAPRIYVSPRRRAQETAAIVAEVYGLSEAQLLTRDELDGEERIPARLAVELAATAAEVLLVGHQPVVEELVRALVGSTRPKLFGFRTATIVSLVPGAGPSRWTLEALHDPDRLPG